MTSPQHIEGKMGASRASYTPLRPAQFSGLYTVEGTSPLRIARCILTVISVVLICVFVAFMAFGEGMMEFAGGMRKTLINSTFLFQPTPSNATYIPKILVWTNFFSADLHAMLVTTGKECPHQCEYLKRQDMWMEDADAVIAHIRDVTKPSLPRARSGSQVYVAFLQESPYHSGSGVGGGAKEKIPNGFFNAVMDYRVENKTYFWGYGRMKKAETVEEMMKRKLLTDTETEGIVDGKKKVALAMISNCNTASKREAYLKELTRHMEITFVGSCFQNISTANYVNCSRSMGEKCEKKLIDEHGFIFAFENSVCKNYVTEKFWRLSQNIVPIVLRRSVMESVAPPGAFVAADDFASPKELATFLMNTAKDRSKYKEYFNWRKTYITVREDSGVCDLCRDLLYKNVSTRSDLNLQQYYSYSQCESGVGTSLLKN